jgi:tetratricopeptide (TPR) repeat protein
VDTTYIQVNKTHIINIILIAFIGFAIYANSLQNQFIWDDEYLVVKNTFIQNRDYIKEIFTTHLFKAVGTESNFYRPIQSLTLLIDYVIWGLNPSGYHLTNTLIHIINAILVYWLALLLLAEVKTALLSALFFLAHPIQVQAVTYISGRADPLMTLFSLLSFILFIRVTKQFSKKLNIGYFGSILCLILALLSKEAASILPVLFLLYLWILQKKNLYRTATSSIIFFIVVAIYFWFRIGILKITGVHPALVNIPLLDRLLIALKAFGQYVGLLVFPSNLHMERIIAIKNGALNIGIWIPLAFLILCIILIFKSANKYKLISFGLSWFLINLLPVSNIYPLNASIAEHWLYLPSIGFFLAVSVFLTEIKYRKTITVISVAILIILSILTIRQNSYWREPISFFQKTLKFRPDNARLYYGLGTVYKKKKMFAEAKREFAKALELNPKYTEVYNDLGNIYLKEKLFDSAIEYYEKAATVSSNLFEPYYNLGNAYYQKGDYGKAILNYKKALSLKKDDPNIHYNLAMVYGKTGQTDEAIKELEATLKLNPNDTHALGLLRELKR